MTYATGSPSALATAPTPIVGTSTTPQTADYAGRSLKDLTDHVLWRFGEAMQTTIGDWDVSHDFKPLEKPGMTTRQLIAVLLNEGAARLCRGPLFVYKTGAQEFTPPNREVTYQSLATDDGSVIWSAESVDWTPDTATAPTTLKYLGRERALTRYGATGNSGKPTQYWSHSGNGIRAWELPTVSGYFTVRGPAIPPPMVADGDAPTWCPPDMTYLLEDYARVELARKVGQSVVYRRAVLFPKVQLWASEWAAAIAKLEAQHRAENPEVYAFHLGAKGPV